MRRPVLGSVVFFLVAPGVVAGLGTWLLTRWEAEAMPLAVRLLGWLLLAGGVGVLVHAFVRFVAEGRGTPAPVAPTERLVVGGAYRWVRNPMYLAVAAVIAGQGLILGRPVLAGYLAVFGAAVFAFVRFYEEPALRRRFGADYEAYRQAVPGWWPRMSPFAGRVRRL